MRCQNRQDVWQVDSKIADWGGNGSGSQYSLGKRYDQKNNGQRVWRETLRWVNRHDDHCRDRRSHMGSSTSTRRSCDGIADTCGDPYDSRHGQLRSCEQECHSNHDASNEIRQHDEMCCERMRHTSKGSIWDLLIAVCVYRHHNKQCLVTCSSAAPFGQNCWRHSPYLEKETRSCDRPHGLRS